MKIFASFSWKKFLLNWLSIQLILFAYFFYIYLGRGGSLNTWMYWTETLIDVPIAGLVFALATNWYQLCSEKIKKWCIGLTILCGWAIGIAITYYTFVQAWDDGWAIFGWIYAWGPIAFTCTFWMSAIGIIDFLRMPKQR